MTRVERLTALIAKISIRSSLQFLSVKGTKLGVSLGVGGPHKDSFILLVTSLLSILALCSRFIFGLLSLISALFCFFPSS